MPEHLADGKTREDHVPEVAPAASLGRNVDSDPGHRQVAGQPPREFVELILAATARKPRVREIVGDFLQAQHVEIGERLGVLHDARRIDLTVDAAAPLDVPGDELHGSSVPRYFYLIPARMNDWTNCR